MLLGWKNQYCQTDYTTQGNLQIQCNPYQITNDLFHRSRTKYFKICKETPETLNNQSNSRKKKKKHPKLVVLGSRSSHNTAKIQLSKQYGTGTKTEIVINGTE